MTDRPIIFSAPMVRALLEGRKTQTRRLATSPLRRCEVGDRLWVRENYWIATHYSYGSTPGGMELNAPPPSEREGDPIHLAADGDPPNCANRHYGADGLCNGAFAAPDPYAVWIRQPSIHMPRWASRLTLIVEAVRVGPLQAISEADASAEGLQFNDGLYHVDHDHHSPSAATSYSGLWCSLHGVESWQANPDVVALTFRVVRGNIDGGGA